MIAGGTATDIRGIRSTAYSIAPALVFGQVSTLSLSGRGVRFSGGEWATGGGAAPAARARLAPAFGVGLQAEPTTPRLPSTSPWRRHPPCRPRELRLGTLTLYAGATAAWARTEIIRPPTLLDPFPTGRPVSRTQLGPVFRRGARAAGGPGRSVVGRLPSVLARGASTADLEVVASKAPADQSLVVAFEVPSDLADRGLPVERALAEVGAKLSARASDTEIASLRNQVHALMKPKKP